MTSMTRAQANRSKSVTAKVLTPTILSIRSFLLSSASPSLPVNSCNGSPILFNYNNPIDPYQFPASQAGVNVPNCISDTDISSISEGR